MQSYPKEAPPPYGMAIPPPPMPQVQVIHTSFGPEPQPLVCPHCQSQVTTRVNVQPTTKTHLAALIICLLCFPCFFVPYCCDSCQSTNHYCPRCNVFLGTYDN
ncbi:lipopolysaccharide-induced tumor necrosis factor-alpha factor homolog [Nesidiocoris tenuis]|uniref:Lipopolysaccharide-induced tumor necrosis factor-alpha factor homolog n=1 Tax=Nesidiocoris tenuis TaxID=355587 RepID=A0ABN7BB65_9HEMI|nr:lipopolysaccharide-induced tumor necrosis factor-alpha factor homolog [Nesidiocoris tenuis]